MVNAKAANDQKTSDPNWRKLEKLVAAIQQKLAPDAKVEHNVRRRGQITGVDRQIDVLLTQKIGQYEMMIVIDAKDYGVKVDTKGVEEFRGLVDDVRAHKGVLVSPLGFTPAAHKTAERYGIELYRPVDTGNHKWRAKASIPVLCDHREARMQLQISCTYNGPLSIPADIGNIEVFDEAGQSLGNVNDAALILWDSAKLPIDPGQHENIPLFGETVTVIENGHGWRAPVNFTAILTVTGRQYFGNLPLTQISGFLDERTGCVIANSFTTGLLDAEKVEREWLLLNDSEPPPVTPVFKITGLVGW